ncbi:hypothetical protein L6164_016530 [Bauhinia variegata]|uniref:Uncharacterized protein n=1 Tax=Bauhinia variegata TaxID=167791 RepID=A0ACB9NQD3_BAUVA|nr:hypothetical protein L6164_016530 [Bauhinia variegata]
MGISFHLFLLLLAMSFQYLCSSSSNVLTLSVEKPEDVIVSKNGMFSAGFHAVGENAYCFAIWFTQNPTIIWVANADQPVNGKRSTLSLLKNGNLVLTDAGEFNVWSTNTESSSEFLELVLENNGNLVLREIHGSILWQSFDFPTNTLLPGQQLTRPIKLVSSRSDTNLSSGFYKLFFDNDNILRLLYDGPSISSIYWPDPWISSWAAGRSTYNDTRVAALDSLGHFSSSDNFKFCTSDCDLLIQRRLTLDYDGNLRVYSRKHEADEWYVSWQVKSNPCKIHGLCGPNSTCSYDSKHGRTCSCLPGYRVKNDSDWSYGCEPKFNLSCNRGESSFQLLHYVEFYGYDYYYQENSTYTKCSNICLESCECKGFQLNFENDKGTFTCYAKLLLLNGQRLPGFRGTTYLRVPKGMNNLSSHIESGGECNRVNFVKFQRVYTKEQVSSFQKFFLWFVSALGALEIVSFFLIWVFLRRTHQKSITFQQGYHPATAGFKRFSYAELKDATRGFSEEIGRGAGGVVYKGVLSDQRVAAIKRLNEANQGEGEFLTEVSIIGRLNHMNLIEMWGYCADGKHRLLVYEYMENGSLATIVMSDTLDWRKRYEIALGMARGLAYLHEECLEWILHCDIKPQNIFLDSDYQPKVADFGLSKLQNRNNLNNLIFSTIRGTRGYMAPEWIFKLPITSKVDVYSYGIVVLEMITGKSSTMGIQTVDGVEEHHGSLVTWVRRKRSERFGMASWVEEIIDPEMEANYDINMMEILAIVALNCVEESKDSRPTMSQVVEMLESHENVIPRDYDGS